VSDLPLTPLRSWLFAPGNHERRVKKALGGPAQAVILDLEDAVPAEDKILARTVIREVLLGGGRRNVFVRINALDTPYAFEDVEAATCAEVGGIMLPKSETARDVQILDWLLFQAERRAGLSAGTMEIVPLLESATSFENLAAICRSSSRVRRLAFGAADFTLDVGMTWSDDEHELLPWRAAMVLASRAAGLDPPIDTPWIQLADSVGMAASASRSRNHGFAGKLCIHPDQVIAVHHAYTPSQAMIDQALRIVSAFEEAGFSATKVDGRMIDGPVVEVARRIISEANQVGAVAPISE
jgi:citrate lyase subunit beta / citryl-CoA lyase